MQLTNEVSLPKAAVAPIDNLQALFKMVHATTQLVHQGIQGMRDFLNAEIVSTRRKNIKTKTAKPSSVEDVIRRLHNSPFYSPSYNAIAPYGYFCGRPVIGDSSPIDGGIYLGAHAQEAVVIDGTYSKLRSVFREFRARFENDQTPGMSEIEVLTMTLQFVRARMTIDSAKTAIINRTIRGEGDRKVSIDMYLEAGCGEARHLTLVGGYLLESLKRLGIVSGFVSIDTTHKDEQLIYTSTSGDIVNLDFALDKIQIGH